MTMGKTLTDLRWLGSQNVLEANGHDDRSPAILTVYGACRETSCCRGRGVEPATCGDPRSAWFKRRFSIVILVPASRIAGLDVNGGALTARI